MSRPLRIEYPGAWYHVMNRGRRSEDIYFDDIDRNEFLNVIKEATDLWNIKIAAYCLMPNHYHLLIHTPDGNLSRSMRHINGVYTQRFNRKHETEGQLFRGRYKAIIIDQDNYLLEVLRYIHRNPIKAGLVESFRDVKWSSHHAYVSKAKKWSWVYKEFVLNQFTQFVSKQKSAYLKFVTLENSEELDSFYSMKNTPAILGGSPFKKYIKDRFASLSNKVEIPESKILAPDTDLVISIICNHYKITTQDLFFSKRGTENIARDMAIYMVRRVCCKTLPEVGKEFGLDNYSSVSSVIQRMKKRLKEDKKVRESLVFIGNKIIKS